MKGIGMKMFSGYSVAAAMLAAATLAGCPVPELHTQELTGSNELNGKQIYLIPVDDDKRAGFGDYARFVEAQEGLTVPVTDAHTAVALETVIELGEPLLFFGNFYSNAVVSANGTVVLSNDANAVAGKNGNLADHFQSRQVSLLPLDATLQGDADILFFQDEEFVVITFDGVTVGATTDNVFQVVFDKRRGVDGDVILSYAVVNSTGTTGAVGISDAPLAGKTEAEIADFLGRFGAGNVISAPSANTPAA